MCERLQARDFRSIFLLLGECRELWLDPDGWQRHLLNGVSGLIHLPVGILVRVRDYNPVGSPQVLHAFESGWEDATHQQHFHGAMGRERLLLLTLNESFRKTKPRRRAAPPLNSGVAADYDWRATRDFAECFGPAHMHEILFSALPMEGGDSHHFLAFGGMDHRPTALDRQRLAYLHSELVALIGRKLAQSDQICLHGLSARRRQIFELLVEGLPEKLIADRIGLRPCTVNEHMQKLYEHFQVHSRSELLAYALRRMPTGK